MHRDPAPGARWCGEGDRHLRDRRAPLVAVGWCGADAGLRPAAWPLLLVRRSASSRTCVLGKEPAARLDRSSRSSRSRPAKFPRCRRPPSDSFRAGLRLSSRHLRRTTTVRQSGLVGRGRRGARAKPARSGKARPHHALRRREQGWPDVLGSPAGMLCPRWLESRPGQDTPGSHERQPEAGGDRLVFAVGCVHDGQR